MWLLIFFLYLYTFLCMKRITHPLMENLFYGNTYCGIEGWQVAVWLLGHLTVRF